MTEKRHRTNLTASSERGENTDEASAVSTVS